ncbi:MAG: hypothetical protein K2P06_04900, partial [Muribaculaceae bacterium]|nr:hypothetical protein [Muribaculaceae bacterium]
RPLKNPQKKAQNNRNKPNTLQGNRPAAGSPAPFYGRTGRNKSGSTAHLATITYSGDKQYYIEKIKNKFQMLYIRNFLCNFE